jgi:hypothetical protein
MDPALRITYISQINRNTLRFSVRISKEVATEGIVDLWLLSICLPMKVADEVLIRI